MRLSEIKEIIRAEICCGTEDSLNIEITNVCASDLMSDVLSFIKPNALLITGLTNPQVVRTADIAEAGAICLVRGKEPPSETIELAKKEGIPLLKTKLSMFTVCGLLYTRALKDCMENAK